MKRLRTAIIGMGKMGKIRYDAMKKHGGFDIVALCDTNRHNLENFTEPCFLDWKQCLEETELDAIIVCTYNAYIPDIVCEALEKGLHVFSEKPPGRNLADTLRMQSSSEKSSSVLKFGFNHRYHNSVIEAKALIDSGLIGEVVCARGVYGKAGNPNFSAEWRNDTALSGGGILLDQGIHMLDLMCYLVGDFTKIKSHVDQLVWKNMPTEDSAFAIMETDKGQVASLHSNAIQWKHKFDLDLICTNGYIALNGLLTATRSYGEERMTYYRKDLAGKTGKLGKPLEHTLCFNTDESWDLEIEEFYEAIVKGMPIKQGTIEQAVTVMKLIQTIYQYGEQ